MFLHTALQETAGRSYDAEALVLNDNRTLNYLELLSLVNKCTRQLHELGVECDSRVGIYLPKDVLSAVAPFAISTLGAVFVPINPLLTTAQVKHIAVDGELSLLITSVDRAKRLEGELKDLDITYLLSDRSYNGASVEFAGEGWNPANYSEDITDVANQNDLAPHEKLAALLYTSGSTGLPKGVMVSHENLVLGRRALTNISVLTALIVYLLCFLQF